MCELCNYPVLLAGSGLEATPNRLHVLEVIGDNDHPLSAAELYETVARRHPINRVTIYRILELLVERGLVEQISGTGRAALYGPAPNEHHRPHPHFYCIRCGRVDCLSADSLAVDADRLLRDFAGQVAKIEVRVEGVCVNCLRSD